MSDIVERLRKIESGQPINDDGFPTLDVTNWYRNPDGPEAADAIESLRARLRDESKAREGREALLRENESLRSRLADLEAERELIVARAENAEAALAYAASTGDECAIEVESLRSRLDAEQRYRAEAVDAATMFKARLAEAEALLREARTVGAMQIPDWLARIDAFLAPDSASVDDKILTADRNAWRARAIELHKAARAYIQVADAILVRMRYRDDPTYDSAAIELGDLLNDRRSAIGSALVAKHGPWNGHAPECKANPINVGHKLHECDCRTGSRSNARYQSAIMAPVKPTQDMLYAMAELDGWQRGDRDHPPLTRWEDYWIAALSALPSATNSESVEGEKWA